MQIKFSLSGPMGHVPAPNIFTIEIYKGIIGK